MPIFHWNWCVEEIQLIGEIEDQFLREAVHIHRSAGTAAGATDLGGSRPAHIPSRTRWMRSATNPWASR